MPRAKTSGPVAEVAETVQEPEILEDQEGSEDSVIERVVNKLQRVVTVKKMLSDRQKAHLDTLAKKKKGKKYVAQVDETEVELPTVVKKKLVIKVPNKRVEKLVVSSSEEEDSSEEAYAPPPKKQRKKVQATTVQQQAYRQEVIYDKSIF